MKISQSQRTVRIAGIMYSIILKMNMGIFACYIWGIVPVVYQQGSAKAKNTLRQKTHACVFGKIKIFKNYILPGQAASL